MPNLTPNYNLKKPTQDEYYDVGVSNENADKIDAALDGLQANKVDKITGKGLSTNDYTTAEKNKLAGIANNANNYSLPLAANGTRGGVQVGYAQNGRNYPVQLSGEKAFVSVPWTDTTYGNATTSQPGLMSAADKTKLNGIASGANNYVLPLAANGTRGGLQLGYTQNGRNYPVQQSGEKAFVNVPWTDTTYGDATTSAHGLMTAADKTKLNGIASGANNYSLPLAASGTRGGLQLGYTQNGRNYPVQQSGEKAFVNVPWTDTNTTYNDATTSAHGLMTAADKTKLNGIDTVALDSGLNRDVVAAIFETRKVNRVVELRWITGDNVTISNNSVVGVVREAFYPNGERAYPVINYMTSKPVNGAMWVSGDGIMTYYGDALPSGKYMVAATWISKT